MTIPGQFPRRFTRSHPVAPQAPGSVPADATADSPAATADRASRPWLLAALLLSGAAQLVTISALVSADPIPASWAALLLAIAPAPLAALAAFAPALAARRYAALAAALVLLIGLIAQITHTGLFFVPALAAMAVAAMTLWRDSTSR